MNETTGKPIISESLCIGCGICINKCPHDALIITQLPSELESDMIHRYSMNGFRLFRLPAPREKQVVGISGPNGMGKSTAINALSGQLIPNLGDWDNLEPNWENVIAELPRGELRDHLTTVSVDGVNIAVKPQYVDHLPKVIKGNVGDLLSNVDEKDELEPICQELGI